MIDAISVFGIAPFGRKSTSHDAKHRCSYQERSRHLYRESSKHSQGHLYTFLGMLARQKYKVHVRLHIWLGKTRLESHHSRSQPRMVFCQCQQKVWFFSAGVGWVCVTGSPWTWSCGSLLSQHIQPSRMTNTKCKRTQDYRTAVFSTLWYFTWHWISFSRSGVIQMVLPGCAKSAIYIRYIWMNPICWQDKLWG